MGLHQQGMGFHYKMRVHFIQECELMGGRNVLSANDGCCMRNRELNTNIFSFSRQTSKGNVLRNPVLN